MTPLAIACVWALGMLVAIPFLRWWAHDLGAIPHRAWMWSGHRRRPWRYAVLAGWLAGGFPAIAVIGTWRVSRLRHELIDTAAELRAARS